MPAQLSSIAQQPNATPTASSELLGVETIRQICNVTRQAVYKHLTDIAPARLDERGVSQWTLDQLPDILRRRIELAKKVKGFHDANHLVDWSRRNESRFNWTLADLTTLEQSLWPKRRAALHDYFRAIESGILKQRAEQIAIATWKAATRDDDHPHGRKCSPKTIRNWLKPIRLCGGPEHAPAVAYSLNGKRCPHGEQLPPAFIDYFNSLLLSNQRKFAPARRKLLRQLENWRATHDEKFRIPGYDAPPPNDKTKNHPYRWTEKYLTDKSRRPNPQTITLARIGPHAASNLNTLVRSTRVGTKVGQFFYFDDQVYDEKVNLLGINKYAQRPLGLDALDYTSGCLFAAMFKPTVWDDTEKAKRKLKEVDMVWFVAHVLSTVGYRTDAVGTTLVVESGTAAIDEAFEKRITDVTNSQVSVIRSRPTNAPAFDGVFGGAGKGNPRVKHCLESARNPLRNEMADFLECPGQQGMDRYHNPEESTGRDRHNTKLLKAWQVAEEIRDFIRFPYNDWNRFCELALTYNEFINRNPEHELEGWVDCGFTTREWRLDTSGDFPWCSVDQFDALPPDRKALVEAALIANPNLVQTRKLQRREVFEAGRKDLRRVEPADIARLVGPDHGTIRHVEKNGTFIKFTDSDVDPYGRELVFLAQVKDRVGHRVDLTAGAPYLCYLNPLDPTQLIVCRDNGGYVGVARAIDGVAWHDTEEKKELLKLQRENAKRSRTDLEVLGALRTRELASQHMQNAGAAAPSRTRERTAAQKDLAASLVGAAANAADDEY